MRDYSKTTEGSKLQTCPFYTVYWKTGTVQFFERGEQPDLFLSECDWVDYCISQTHYFLRNKNDWHPAPHPDYVNFGDICRKFFNMQAQYGSRFLSKPLEGEENSKPYLGENIRLLGDVTDYHSLMVHKDDVAELICRFRSTQSN